MFVFLDVFLLKQFSLTLCILIQFFKIIFRHNDTNKTLLYVRSIALNWNFGNYN